MYALAHAGFRGVGWARRVAIARAWAVVLICGLSLAACTVGPDYKPEPAPVPEKFKEAKGFRFANPSDALDRGDWWAPYRDPKLDLLLRQVEISNQTVAAQAAAYEEARAVIRESQAALFPTVGTNYSVTRTRTGSRLSANGKTVYTTTYQSQTSIGSAASAGWDLDVWGKVRRQIESDSAAAQASKADLDNVKLSQQAMLATAYFNLRTEDSLADLLTRTVAEYKKTLDIVQKQFNVGYGPPGSTCCTAADVATAKAQVETTEAQLINVGVQRSQFEHTIAVLIGRPPAELTIGRHLLSGTIPHIPLTVPSSLLERRPDIAEAERTMQQQNALIGVAEAAFYPDINLSALLTFSSNKFALPITAPNMIWSLGASASETLLDGGLRSAELDAARAMYWGSVANYRQTVLTAFQQVEDELAAIRLLKQQLVAQQQAVRDQRTAVNVFLNQFQAGTAAFTSVVVAEVQLLADEEAELTIRQDLFLASVSLIEALGGRWDTTLLPSREELEKSFSFLPKLPTQ